MPACCTLLVTGSWAPQFDTDAGLVAPHTCGCASETHWAGAWECSDDLTLTLPLTCVTEAQQKAVTPPCHTETVLVLDRSGPEGHPTEQSCRWHSCRAPMWTSAPWQRPLFRAMAHTGRAIGTMSRCCAILCQRPCFAKAALCTSRHGVAFTGAAVHLLRSCLARPRHFTGGNGIIEGLHDANGRMRLAAVEIANDSRVLQ